ncbi:putative TB2/DP1 protein [Ordospora pajunii]|uniref:putative TB2/DP1 protein n=1 Tax=Ordospora pajunii TaxID=3039483 RepID=UPI002952800F|nr:putative TB2/DP1 protein [Ordospora pajunii]KAH9411364.1 putative TB2/DP1 protein [Ordospora pajunii]
MIRQIVNVCVAFVVFYNVLQAFKASKDDKKLSRRYSKCFMVISVFLVIDNMFSFVLNIVPFYQLFKLIVIVWISIPACTGAVFVYKFYVQGILEKHESQLDETIENVKTVVSRYFSECYGKAQKRCYMSKDEKAKREIMDDEAGEQLKDEENAGNADESELSAIDSTSANEEKAVPEAGFK